MAFIVWADGQQTMNQGNSGSQSWPVSISSGSVTLGANVVVTNVPTIQFVQNYWTQTPTFTPTITSTPTNTPTAIINAAMSPTPGQSLWTWAQQAGSWTLAVSNPPTPVNTSTTPQAHIIILTSTPTPTFTGSFTYTSTFTNTPTNTWTPLSVANPATPDQTKLAGKDIQLTQAFLQGLQATITSTFTSTVTPTPTNTPTWEINNDSRQRQTATQTPLNLGPIQTAGVEQLTATQTPVPVVFKATPQNQEVGLSFSVTVTGVAFTGGAATPAITPPPFIPKWMNMWATTSNSGAAVVTIGINGYDQFVKGQTIIPGVGCTGVTSVGYYNFNSSAGASIVPCTSYYANVVATVTGTPTVTIYTNFRR